MEAPENFKSPEQIILEWNTKSPEDTSVFNLELDQFLKGIDGIKTSTDEDKSKSESLIETAMTKLEVIFRKILVSHTNPTETDFLIDQSISNHSTLTTPSSENSTDEDDSINDISISTSARTSICEIDLVSCEWSNILWNIAERMINCGYAEKCTEVYASVRKPIMEASFEKLGLEDLSVGDIQRLKWIVLERKIRKWIKGVKVCVRVLFANEKRLCEQVFGGLGIEEDCFAETVKAIGVRVFEFAEAVSVGDRSPEKLFKMLDIYDALCDLLPDVEFVFGSESLEAVRVQVRGILSRLAEAVREILLVFENAVLEEPSRVQVPGGTIHPLTRYVMNYASLICDYKQTLVELIVSNPVTTPDMDFVEGENENQNPLATHLLWTIVILQFNLDGKSKYYKDSSLANLFMMNNVHYIVQKIKGSSELREMIGDNYLRRLTAKYRQLATGYERSTWVNVLHCLRDEGLRVSGNFSSGVSKKVLRERFKAFNSMFDEVHKTQATWFVPDSQLREELRISISEKLIPAYRSFLGRYRSYIESGRHPENYIKYAVEDLETLLLDFFEGNPLSQHSSWRSH